jgi:tRNA 5-methylaminomethyl-2-thiouridine biosynthesis bifunctional protein
LTIGELGFGTGLNLFATLCRIAQSCEILYFSVEKYPLSKAQIFGITCEYSRENPKIYASFLEHYDKLFCAIKNGFNSAIWDFGKIRVNFNLYFGDVSDFLDELDTKIDCWYLDGHSPDKNPEMWSESVCKKVYEKSKIEATAATYSACGTVKRNLRAAGFFVKLQKGFGVKRHKLFVEKR